MNVSVLTTHRMAYFNNVELIQTPDQCLWIKDITPKINNKEEEIYVSRKRHPNSNTI